MKLSRTARSNSNLDEQTLNKLMESGSQNLGKSSQSTFYMSDRSENNVMSSVKYFINHSPSIATVPVKSLKKTNRQDLAMTKDLSLFNSIYHETKFNPVAEKKKFAPVVNNYLRFDKDEIKTDNCKHLV